jgi:hypothetical protein
MKPMAYLILAVLLSAGATTAYDPLYYDNLTEVLHSMEAHGGVALGYFGAGSYWMTDSLGGSDLYDYRTSLGILRVLFLGRYGLTNSHTISIAVPAFFQIQGESDSTGLGIADPWVSLDGWISREPQIIARGALRLPLKGALESGDYSESDRHLALDGAVTVETSLSQGSDATVQATGGLRYSFWAWDGLFDSPRDSAETQPPVELRFTGFLRYPFNQELTIRLGGEIASRGELSARSGDSSWTQQGSGFSQVDLRAGFELNNSSMDLTAEVFYRLSGENTDKEWGIMIDGTGLDLLSLFSTTSGTR